MNDFPVVYLNTNDGTGLLAFGEGNRMSSSDKNSLKHVQSFLDKNKRRYVFGYLSYDIKNQIEDLESDNLDGVKMPETFFYSPKYVVRIIGENFEFIQGQKDSEALKFVTEFLDKEITQRYPKQNIDFKPRTSKENYLETVTKLKDHIQQGDIYEVTFCQEFYADKIELKDPLGEYFKMNQVTKAPYSSYIHFDDYYILCGSPELFLKRQGSELLSKPIKGTHKRGADELQDNEFKINLLNNQKERSENVMIVDLVRNDLSKIADKGSVEVKELFGIYSFETVHQMISTITAEQLPNKSITDLLEALFPMGSMTGAPKHSAMQLIEKYEDFKRGVFSGTIGYIQPNGDFDFNVVIRSLLYNAKEKYISCPVGGAITINSDPEKEFEECEIKVSSIMKALNSPFENA